MDVRSLPLSHIYPGEGRLRATQPDKVAELARSIERLGLQTPLTVKPCTKVRDGVPSDAWEIVTGHHRFEALRKLARAEVDCKIWDGDAKQARLWEIAENLHRADLLPVERAAHIDEWRRITLEKGCQDDTPLGGIQPHDRGYQKTAESLGIDKNAVRRAEKITSLPDAIKEQAKEEKWSQDKLLRAAAPAPAKPVPLPPSPRNDFEVENAQMAALMNAWNKAGPKVRERFLEEVQSPVFDQTRAGAA